MRMEAGRGNYFLPRPGTYVGEANAGVNVVSMAEMSKIGVMQAQIKGERAVG